MSPRHLDAPQEATRTPDGGGENLLAITLASIADGVITTDDGGRIAWMNAAAERMTEWPLADAVGTPLAYIYATIDEFTRLITEPGAGQVPFVVDAYESRHHKVLVARSGRELFVEDSLAPLVFDAEGAVGSLLVFRDVTEQRRLARDLSHHVKHDTLTGLLNRVEFDLRLGDAITAARQLDAQHALLLVDLDRFKLVNDACSHEAGDRLLQQVAGLLRSLVRPRDTLARLGGDEFAIILEHCPPDTALEIGKSICECLDDYRYVFADKRFRIGASVGLAPIDASLGGAEGIKQAADLACYRAKEAGGGRVHAWHPDDLGVDAHRIAIQWAPLIEAALESDGFALMCQRMQSLAAKGAGIHAEVLIRMRAADGSLVPPGLFLPTAERYHLAPRIDRWVLDHVLQWMAGQASLATLDCLCVNLSGQSVQDRMFHGWALERLRTSGPELCARLCVEITETSAITNLAEAARLVRDLRALGVRVALDDFGAGASSFGYLRQLQVDFLKIDGQFIRDITTDRLAEATVRCFVDVAGVLGVETIAEFVDSAAAIARVAELGVDLAQGYHVHRPEPIDRLLAAEGQRR